MEIRILLINYCNLAINHIFYILFYNTMIMIYQFKTFISQLMREFYRPYYVGINFIHI